MFLSWLFSRLSRFFCHLVSVERIQFEMMTKLAKGHGFVTEESPNDRSCHFAAQTDSQQGDTNKLSLTNPLRSAEQRHATQTEDVVTIEACIKLSIDDLNRKTGQHQYT